MGAFRGSLTYSKFHVRGRLPQDFKTRFVEAVRLRAFRELDPGEEADHRCGWCSVEHPFDLDLTQEKLFWNGYLNLGFRTDTWRIPSALYKASFREVEREFCASNGLEKLSRAQKKNLEAVVVSQLRRKLVPAMKVVDLSWALDEGVVRFFHQSPKVHDAMIELFEKTFELDLALDGAFLLAESRGLAAAEALPQLEPTTFHPQGA